ncbi:hypothetical protein JCM15548_11816 [Geofilum rubicundum JCM 15548]|uniref:Glycoamylase-like domain-containing protein n=2 Tax=Geofilum TaxID=1236988 RepID=A0A0E9LWI2_9BACT|nr:hypothetical protein JCM15548_11816 [Geofilum rubicundum JCM 15548]
MSYQIYASFDNQETYQLRHTTEEPYCLDFVPQQYRNSTVHYRIVAEASGETSQAAEASAVIRDFTDDELMDMVQSYSFRYFWEGAHAGSGMAMERSHVGGSTVTSGATGMGLMAMIVAHERAFENPEAIKERVLKILTSLETCERHHGAWSHWYDGDTYQTLPFSAGDDGGDLVETSFVAQGLLAVRNYFTGTDNASVQIREKATQLWEAIEWDWYRNGDQNVLFWHWSPNTHFAKNMKIYGWNEALVTYILAAASPTHSIPKEVYEQGWAGNGDMVNRRVFYTHELFLSPNWGGPLFWVHYSHLGINPRGLSDQYANYWQEYVNTVKIHHAYAIDNPLNHKGYSTNCWGLTASDDPFGYTAHEPMNNDNGTISPTAALSSMPYLPEASMMALKYFYRERGQDLFGLYGPYDAFNEKYNWVQKSYIGIDQGPIVSMLENHRTGLLWNTVMKDADLQAGLNQLGFAYQTSTSTRSVPASEELRLYPNPASKQVGIEWSTKDNNQPIHVNIFTLHGQMVQSQQLTAGETGLVVNISELPNGVYLTNVRCGAHQYSTKLIIQKQQ